MTAGASTVAPVRQARLAEDLEWRKAFVHEREQPLGPARVPSGEGRHTLAIRIASVWEGLSSSGAAACPICGGRMEWHRAVGVCGGCGTTLS